MAGTKWDELQSDCLVEIFTKLSTEEIVESVQYVCKSWYQATLNPQCWQTFTFSESLCSLAFIEFALRRSEGSATAFIWPGTFFEIEEASLIVKFIPKIKCLKMRGSDVPRDCLVMILEGCKELEFVDVSDCTGFNEKDPEIKKLASNIAFFDASRSTVDHFDYFDYYDPPLYHDSVLFDDEYFLIELLDNSMQLFKG